MSLVTIENVDMRYGGPGGTLAVQGLDMRVNKGEFVAVVGPSGCGKSTLMKLVTGLHIPQDGVVTVAGAQVTEPVSIVGMAFQNPTMLPWRTTLATVLLPLDIGTGCGPTGPSMWRRPRRCWRRSGSRGSATSFHGSCRAACSSAPIFAGR